MSDFITPHFKWSEAICTDTGMSNLPSDYAKANLVQTFRILEDVRSSLGLPIKINSAFRTPQVNKVVGGRSDSFHLDGRAVDIDITPYNDKAKTKLLNLLQQHRPVDFYITNTFVHVAY